MADIAHIQLNDTVLDIKDPTARTDIASLSGRVGRLDHKRWIIIGDSYGTGFTNYDGTVTPNWIDTLQTMLGAANADFYRAAQNGAGFTVGTTFLALLQSLTVTYPETITDIVIAGGYNDRSADAETITAALEAFNTYAIATYPNATIHLGSIGWAKDVDRRYDIARRIWTTYRNCQALGWHYMAGTEYILHNYRLFSSDGTHPNLNGQNALANGIYMALINGYSYPYYNYTEPAITLDSQFSSGGGWACFGMEGGTVHQGLAAGYCVFATTPATITQDTPIKIGTIANPYVSMGSNNVNDNYCTIATPVRYRKTDYSFENGAGLFAFKCNSSTPELELWFRPFNGSYSDINGILWPACGNTELAQFC